MTNRAEDNWYLLVAIADLAGCGQGARKAAVALTATKETTSVSQELLADLRDIFREHKETETWRSFTLVDALCQDPTRRWATHNHGQPISVRQLALLLKPYGIEPARVRADREWRGYYVADFKDTFKRYLS